MPFLSSWVFWYTRVTVWPTLIGHFLLDKQAIFCLNSSMNSSEIRVKFLKFFESKGHIIVPSSSLIPDDPSVLLTTAGMQQFKPYYTGKADPMKDFGAKNTASIQKSFRTSDIDEVGDSRHLTFFEMLGNFSFGGYFKKEAIAFAHEFITKEIGLTISYVTIFKGSDVVPKDEESRAIWKSLGVQDVREEGMEDVFWGPTGSSGPCGPTTEIYCKNADDEDIEVWNVVFNEFMCSGSREELLSGNATLTELPQKGIDTGMGFERLAMSTQHTSTIFETDLFAPLLQLLPETLEISKQRVIVDHSRAMAFLIADGVRPSNKEAGYILRRIMRRVMAYEKTDSLPEHVLQTIVHEVIHMYGDFYPELKHEADAIKNVLEEERSKFSKTLANGLRALKKESTIDTQVAFKIYETFGLPFEIIKEVGGKQAQTLTLADFETEFKKHQEISRAGREQKFGGHGLILDTGELKAGNEEELKKVTRLHTATHLMQAALRKVLGPDVKQMGSDITPERTRFDFSFSRKVTPDELKQVADLVNNAIQQDLTMEPKKMKYEDAIKTDALYFFKEKYPEEVNVYSAYDSKTNEVFSREFCGGPHVTHTSEIGHFKILKEESSSAGVRRIRATVE
jgi:alanyl-tRNA synthetase